MCRSTITVTAYTDYAILELTRRINADYGMDSVGPSVALVMVSNAGRFLPAERAMLDRGDRLGPLRGRW